MLQVMPQLDRGGITFSRCSHWQRTLGMPTLLLVPKRLFKNLRQQLRRVCDLIRGHVLQRLLIHCHLRTERPRKCKQSSSNKHAGAGLYPIRMGSIHKQRFFNLMNHHMLPIADQSWFHSAAACANTLLCTFRSCWHNLPVLIRVLQYSPAVSGPHPVNDDHKLIRWSNFGSMLGWWTQHYIYAHRAKDTASTRNSIVQGHSVV
jgi:hypothetical protein